MTIRCDELTVCRGGVPVIKTLSLVVPKGESIAIRGINGSGKTTLLWTLAGLIPATSGTVVIDGEDFSRSDAHRRTTRLNRIGLVLQSIDLIPELTLTENIELPLRLGSKSYGRVDLDRAIKPLMERLGIQHLADRRPGDVSGGEAQRAAIARAVVHRPPVVLADEPTGALDDQASTVAMKLLLEVSRSQRSSVVIVSHDDDVAASCDRQAWLVDGTITD